MRGHGDSGSASRSIRQQYLDAIKIRDGYEDRSRDFGREITSCSECPAPGEHNIKAPLPCSWCKDVYKCPVAMTDPPDAYFSWILECYTLQSAGFTIDNSKLSLSEWYDLGILKGLLEAKREQESLASVSQEMLLTLVEANRRRR